MKLPSIHFNFVTFCGAFLMAVGAVVVFLELLKYAFIHGAVLGVVGVLWVAGIVLMLVGHIFLEGE